MAETQPIKLLVVDDDARVRAVLARALQSSARVRGIEIVLKATADGQSALEVMPTFQPDVVLLDLRMQPWGDECGILVTERIRGDALQYGEPFVILHSAYADQPCIPEAALAAGVDEVYVKPCEVEELLEAIVRGAMAHRLTTR